MWPFTKGSESAPLPPQVISEEMRRAERIERYAARLTVRICNTGEWAAVGRRTVAWGATRDDAILRHMARVSKKFPRDPYPRPLHPRLVWASDTQAWCAIAKGICAEGPTQQIAVARLGVRLGKMK